jgi:hypothetical protein
MSDIDLEYTPITTPITQSTDALGALALSKALRKFGWAIGDNEASAILTALDGWRLVPAEPAPDADKRHIASG